eukprot:GGOE01045419.1.p1 GENE.GGOE01045419.1~~GGOE01045419.1.p1  ORF type:complete len:631 (-),score=147.17 GGOE01045419.1:238-2130(-)
MDPPAIPVERRPPPGARRPRTLRRATQSSDSFSPLLPKPCGWGDEPVSTTAATTSSTHATSILARGHSPGRPGSHTGPQLSRISSEPVMRRGRPTADQLMGTTLEHISVEDTGEWYQEHRHLHYSAFFWDPFIASSEWIGVRNVPSRHKKNMWYIGGIPWPSLLFLAVEFCVHCSYAGIVVALLLYLKDELRLSTSRATALFLWFLAGTRLAPLLAGWLADSHYGKNIVLLGCLLLAVGGAALPLAGYLLPHHLAPLSLLLTVCGLTAAAFGIGGVRPCISALGPAQINPDGRDAEVSTRHYFQGLHIAVAGGLVTGALAAMFAVAHLGVWACFLVIGLPLVVSATLLWAFRAHVIPLSPCGFTLSVLWSVVCVAVKWRRYCGPGAGHWLDSAIPVHGQLIVEEAKPVVALLPVFAALALVWALLAQALPAWTLQARTLTHPLWLSPAAAPAFHLMLIPVFLLLLQRVVLPRLRHRASHPLLLPLMAAGVAAAAAAYGMAGLLQVVQERFGPIPLWWQAPQWAALAAGTVLVLVPCQELACSEVSDVMRSAAVGLLYGTMAFSLVLWAVLYPILAPVLSLGGVQDWCCMLLLLGPLVVITRMAKGYHYVSAGPDIFGALEYDIGERESVF